jgi:hypothetical protein
MKLITMDSNGQSGGNPGLTEQQEQLLIHFNKLNGKMRDLVLGVTEGLSRSERNRVEFPSLRLVGGAA